MQRLVATVASWKAGAGRRRRICAAGNIFQLLHRRPPWKQHLLILFVWRRQLSVCVHHLELEVWRVTGETKTTEFTIHDSRFKIHDSRFKIHDSRDGFFRLNAPRTKNSSGFNARRQRCQPSTSSCMWYVRRWVDDVSFQERMVDKLHFVPRSWAES